MAPHALLNFAVSGTSDLARGSSPARATVCRRRLVPPSCAKQPPNSTSPPPPLPSAPSPPNSPSLAPIPAPSSQPWPDEPQSISDSSSAWRKALVDVLRGDMNAKEAFADVLTPNCSWDSEVQRVSGIDGVAQMLSEFVGFAIDPVILFTREEEDEMGESSEPRKEDGSEGKLISLDWLLSFTYPLPWRPRVTVSGTTSLSVDENGRGIDRVVDRWDAGATSVIRQVLPRLVDVIWLYAAPHAELDIGTRRTIHAGSGYRIVRVAARPEMRIRCALSAAEGDIVTAVPAIPASAFTGGLRRLEDYSTVAPIAVRSVGESVWGVVQDGKGGNDEELLDVWEFAVPIPGTIFGSSKAPSVPSEESEEVRFVMTETRQCAVMRYRGFAKNELLTAKLESLVGELRRDGFVGPEEEVTGDRVWSRSYDSKAGFNQASRLAIGTCGTTAGVPPRWNELMIELASDVVQQTGAEVNTKDME